MNDRSQVPEWKSAGLNGCSVCVRRISVEREPADEREDDRRCARRPSSPGPRRRRREQPVRRALDGPDDGVQERALAAEHARHVAAEQRHDRDDERAEDRDLEEALGHRAQKASRRAAARRRGRRRSATRRRAPSDVRARSYAVESLDAGAQQREDDEGDDDGDEVHASIGAARIVKAAVENPRLAVIQIVVKTASGGEAVADARVGADVARAGSPGSILRRRLAMCVRSVATSSA